MTTPSIHASGLPVQQRNLMRLLGYVYQQNGHSDRAVVLFAALHALEPADLDVLHSFAFAQARLGRVEQVLALLQPVASAGKGNALTHLLLAQALTQSGRLPEATQSMRRFVRNRVRAHREA